MDIVTALKTQVPALPAIHHQTVVTLAEALGRGAGKLGRVDAAEVIKTTEGITRLWGTRYDAIVVAGQTIGLWAVDSAGGLVASGQAPLATSAASASEEPAVEVTARRKGVGHTPPEVPAEEVGWYAGDQGLVALAVESTACFGGYQEGHRECGACPLRGFCFEATVARAAHEALALDNEFQAELAKAEKAALRAQAPAPVAEEAPEEAPGEAPEEAPGEILQTLARAVYTAKIVVSPFRSFCSASCGKQIEAGETGISVTNHGFYHPNCALALVGGAK